jgi:hypothetical protein
VIMDGEITVRYTLEGRGYTMMAPLRDMLNQYPSSGAKSHIRIVSCFPEELFVDGKPSDLFQCPVCFETANDPVMCCGDNQHTFCRACLTKWLDTVESCPTCKCDVTVDTLLKNRMAAEYIGQCKVRCLMAIPEEGAPAAKKRKTSKKTDPGTCEWVGTIETLDAHMQECAYVHIECQYGGSRGCGWAGARRTLFEHAEECEYREEECDFCSTDVQVCDMEEHKAICIYRPVVCRNRGCTTKHAYNNTLEHLAVCPKEEIECPHFFTLGCSFTCARSSMPAHASDASAHFAGLMTNLKASQQTVAQLQNENAKIQLELRTIKQEMKINANWNHGCLGPIQPRPSSNTFANCVFPTHEQMIGGMKWGLGVMVSDGKVWAVLTLINGIGCPFEITYHLSSTQDPQCKPDHTLAPLNVTTTLIGVMVTDAGGAIVGGYEAIQLATVSYLDQWHKRGYTLSLYGTFKFKIAST